MSGWPWMVRTTALEIALDDVRDSLTYAREEAREQRARYDALLDKYHALRVAGANPAAPAPEPQAKAAPDPVTQAMIARGAGNRALMKHYAQYVTEERAKGTTEATIAANILAGETMEDGVPGAG